MSIDLLPYLGKETSDGIKDQASGYTSGLYSTYTGCTQPKGIHKLKPGILLRATAEDSSGQNESMPSSGDAMDLDGSENRAPGNLESNPDQTEPYVNIFRHISPENQGPQRGTNASPEESEQSISPSPPSQQLPGPLGYDSRDPGAIYDDDYDDTLLPPALAKDYEDTDSELANSAVGDALSDALRYFGSGLPEEHKLVESYGLTSLQIIHISKLPRYRELVTAYSRAFDRRHRAFTVS